MNKIAKLANKCQRLADNTGKKHCIVNRDKELMVIPYQDKRQGDSFLWGYSAKKVKND